MPVLGEHAYGSLPVLDIPASSQGTRPMTNCSATLLSREALDVLLGIPVRDCRHWIGWRLLEECRSPDHFLSGYRKIVALSVKSASIEH